jgi:hypothetical protein
MLYDFFHWLGWQTANLVQWFLRQPDWLQAIALFLMIAGAVYYMGWDNRRYAGRAR